MEDKPYEVKLEISGPMAMWTRPDTGDAPVSYPAPTFGAVKGIFESILLSDWAEVIPTKIEVCKPIIYHNYYTNYGGTLRGDEILKSGGSYQLLAKVLIDVCYRLYALVDSIPVNYNKCGNREEKRQQIGTTNGAHAYQDRFNKRLKKGQMYYMPCLGWKEFIPDYIGEFRANTQVCTEVNEFMSSMLRACFPKGKHSEWDPQYDQNVEIRNGVLAYAK
jgi:CRISPR-associated protein Cas5d